MIKHQQERCVSSEFLPVSSPQQWFCWSFKGNVLHILPLRLVQSRVSFAGAGQAGAGGFPNPSRGIF